MPQVGPPATDVEGSTTTGLPRAGAYVFTTSSGKPLNRNNVAKRGLDNAARAAGLNRDEVPKLGFHDLRHRSRAT